MNYLNLIRSAGRVTREITALAKKWELVVQALSKHIMTASNQKYSVEVKYAPIELEIISVQFLRLGMRKRDVLSLRPL